MTYKVNALFGGAFKVVDKDNVRTASLYVKDIDGDFTENIDDYVYRNTGLLKQLRHNEKILSAIDNPQAYIDKRNKVLKEIAESAVDLFKKEFQNCLNRNFTQEKAEKYAMNEVSEYKNKMLKLLDEEYPLMIGNKNVQNFETK